VARPIEPAELLLQANQLASRGKTTPPRTVDLRQAVSSAYYALYHCITRQVTLYILPQAQSSERYEFVRHFKHDGILQVCNWILRQNDQTPAQTRECSSTMRTSKELLTIADTFKQLQQQRHQADYDHGAEFTKEEVLGVIQLSTAAIEIIMRLSKVNPITLRCDPTFELFAAHVTLKAQMRPV